MGERECTRAAVVPCVGCCCLGALVIAVAWVLLELAGGGAVGGGVVRLLLERVTRTGGGSGLRGSRPWGSGDLADGVEVLLLLRRGEGDPGYGGLVAAGLCAGSAADRGRGCG